MIDNVKHIYFLGIGGIGMSALARYFLSRGVNVSGYDRTKTPLTRELEQAGMAVHYTDSPEKIPADIALAVYTPAIPQHLAELNYIREKGIPLLSRAELLGEITQGQITLAVAGTHGKTSVSTTCAHIFYGSSAGCSAFLGGISKNYGTNFLSGHPGSPVVVEADEYARSFLHLKPRYALITSLDADHLDIYGSHSNLLDSFHAFAEGIQKGGALIVKKGLESHFQLLGHIDIYTYSLTEPADFYFDKLEFSRGSYHFDFCTPVSRFSGLKLSQPGRMYAENAVAAAALAWCYGLDEEEIAAGLASFKGVNRRFDLRLNTGGVVYIDDYAHHPREIDYCIQSARELFPGRKLTGIFQPHLFSRTRDFASGFAESLSALDEIILLDIYPAREEPLPGIDSALLLNLINNPNKCLLQPEELNSHVVASDPQVVITMGAGDIDRCVEPLTNALSDYIKR